MKLHLLILILFLQTVTLADVDSFDDDVDVNDNAFDSGSNDVDVVLIPLDNGTNVIYMLPASFLIFAFAHLISLSDEVSRKVSRKQTIFFIFSSLSCKTQNTFRHR